MFSTENKIWDVAFSWLKRKFLVCSLESFDAQMELALHQDYCLIEERKSSYFEDLEGCLDFQVREAKERLEV